MKKFKYIYICFTVVLLLLSSCESYLDKAPETTISKEVAFKTFTSFQGFIEEMYNAMPDKMKCSFQSSFNWGEDEIANVGSISSVQLTSAFDQGNYWAWQAPSWDSNSNIHHWLDKPKDNPSARDNDAHGLWSGAWYCIRKANLGIENFDILQDATQEEKDLILGQLYFFRAWWHFEMSVLWGGLPYIDTVLPADIPRYPRLSYRELADKAAADFRMAADLLPIDWDKTAPGANTIGFNTFRLNKIAALGYLGKTYLWAASPLIENGAQVGGANTYKYNAEYAAKAADAFGELLALVENGETQYALTEFAYKDVYDHERESGVLSNYTDIFYSINDNFRIPGSTEAILCGPTHDGHNSVWSHGYHWGPKINGLVPHDNYCRHTTANYVNNYGMANGLPINDPASGYDPNHPYKDRDPRFYHDIIFDGFEYVNQSIDNPNEEYMKYVNMSTGGWTRDPNTGSRTGYLIQKLCPHQINKFDKWDNWNNKFHANLPYLRLADVYLMYAEACAAVGGANHKSPKFAKSAVEALNTIRERAGAGVVADSYTGDNNKFMDEVRRERAVELAFEAYRFDDLRRWLLLTEYPYNVKTSHEFNRVENDDFYKNNDPRDAEISGLKEEVILTRQYSAKHYWLPFKKDDVLLYPEFVQNPGW